MQQRPQTESKARRKQNQLESGQSTTIMITATRSRRREDSVPHQTNSSRMGASATQTTRRTCQPVGMTAQLTSLLSRTAEWRVDDVTLLSSKRWWDRGNQRQSHEECHMKVRSDRWSILVRLPPNVRFNLREDPDTRTRRGSV